MNKRESNLIDYLRKHKKGMQWEEAQLIAYQLSEDGYLDKAQYLFVCRVLNDCRCVRRSGKDPSPGLLVELCAVSNVFEGVLAKG